jgi:ribonuclease HI
MSANFQASLPFHVLPKNTPVLLADGLARPPVWQHQRLKHRIILRKALGEVSESYWKYWYMRMWIRVHPQHVRQQAGLTAKDREHIATSVVPSLKVGKGGDKKTRLDSNPAWRLMAPPQPSSITDECPSTAVVQFDGSCLKNGTPEAVGSWGFTIRRGGRLVCKKNGPTISSLVTSNISEWQGLLNALRQIAAFPKPYTTAHLVIKGDSRLVINTLAGQWRAKKEHLATHRDECLRCLAEIGLPWFAEWIPREQNEECDALAGAQGI